MIPTIVHPSPLENVILAQTRPSQLLSLNRQRHAWTSGRVAPQCFVAAPCISSSISSSSTEIIVCQSSIDDSATPAASSSTVLISQKCAAKRKVEELLESGASLYRAGSELGPAIEALIEGNPTSDPGPATLSMGQGTWEVFYAPHIVSLSSTMGTRFQPIRYILKGDQITSNVFYSSSLAQEGWLSSSGRLFSNASDTVEVAFDKFWIDVGSTKLRPTLSEGSSGLKGAVDTLVNTVGRMAFFPQFAVFPVKYLDADMAVFSFPPLNDSRIAVRKVQ